MGTQNLTFTVSMPLLPETRPMPASRITAMKITKTVTGNWWQSREIRPYLIESISHFNEARVYSRKNDEIGRCESIRKGLNILRTGLNDDLYDDAFFDSRPDFLWQPIEWLFDHSSNRLAVYGTLRPGESNHRVIEHIPGEWSSGFVHGYVEEYYGFPFFVWDAEADKIPVEVLSSSELCNSWEMIDRFEGRWYDRILVPVCDSDDDILFIANIYCKSSRTFHPHNGS